MTRMAVIGMALIVLASAGCTDIREIESLKSANASLSEKIAFLNTRVKAVEDACLQLNERLMTAEPRDRTLEQAVTVKPDSKIDSFVKPESNARPTRSTFSHRMVNMTIAEVMAAFGKPDNVSDNSGAQQWTYNELVLAKESGGVEQSPALIVFEQGSVSRAVLTEKVQDSSEPKESESSNAVVQTDQ